MKKTIKEFIDEKGVSAFGTWFEDLDASAAAKVTTSLYRLEQGNVSNVESVGEGVFELWVCAAGCVPD